MLKTKVVCFDYKDKPATLTLSESSGRMGVKRGFFSIQGNEANRIDLEKGEVPIDLIFMRRTMYPDMIGAVIATENFDLPKTPDEFVGLLEEMPEPTVSEWNADVYELNPHWRETDDTEEAKKKGTSAG
jgi:hypothetical protein